MKNKYRINIILTILSHLFLMFTFDSLVFSNMQIETSQRVISIDVSAWHYVIVVLPLIWIFFMWFAKKMLMYHNLSWKFIFFTLLILTILSWINPISLGVIKEFGIYNGLSLVVVVVVWMMSYRYHQLAVKNESVIKEKHKQLLGYLYFVIGFTILFASLYQANSYRLLVLDAAYMVFAQLFAFFYLEYLEKKYKTEEDRMD